MRYKPSEPPEWDPQSEPTFWINQASRRLMRQFDRALRVFEFGGAYFPVAAALAKHGELTQRELLALSDIEQPTMAALLARMERDGFVERAPHATDRRAVNFSLSAKAKARVPKARAAMHDVAHRALAGFTETERTAFLGYLERVVKNLDADEDTSADASSR